MGGDREEWRPYPADPRYWVSSHGRIRSHVRVVPRILKYARKPNGYLQTKLGGHRTVMAHRAVAETFLPNPEGRPEVAHFDGDKTNNRVENLRWATPLENHSDRQRHGTLPKGERNMKAVLTETDVVSIRRHPGGYGEITKLALAYGVTTSAIYNVRSRRTWTHV